MNNFAAIDLGTNTARLLIATRDEAGRICPLLVKRKIIRLGGGFSKDHGISPEAWQRALATLSEFATELRQFNIAAVRAVATSAVRDAVNGMALCAEILRLTGITLEIIAGEVEGFLTLQGVRAGLLTAKRNLLVLDVGGGSTEFSLACATEPLYAESLPLGVVRLTEGCVSNPAMADKIAQELAGLYRRFQQQGWLAYLSEAELVATAGTATTLAAISMGMVDYDYRKVNNFTLERAEIQAIFNRLLPLSPAERLTVMGMEPGREDLIIAGILLTLQSMDCFGFTHLKVSDFGLLEGVFLSIADHGPANVRI